MPHASAVGNKPPLVIPFPPRVGVEMRVGWGEAWRGVLQSSLDDGPHILPPHCGHTIRASSHDQKVREGVAACPMASTTKNLVP